MSKLFDLRQDWSKIKRHKEPKLSLEKFYIDFRTTQSSSGFIVTLPTRPDHIYRIDIRSKFVSGDKIFILLESNFDQYRIIQRDQWLFQEEDVNYHFSIQFIAPSSLTDFGILSWTDCTHMEISHCTINECTKSDLEKVNLTNNKTKEKYNENNVNNEEENEEENEDYEEENEEENLEENEDEEENRKYDIEEDMDGDDDDVEDDGRDELKELLPSQFILPADLYDRNVENNSEEELLDVEVEKDISDEREEEIFNEDSGEENYVDDSAVGIDMDEDIRLVDLGFDKLEIIK